MDFRYFFMMQLFTVIRLLCFLWADGVQGIVNQELILTPKQGLQLSGKRIYYEDQIPPNTSMISNTTSSRAWERALKHVTYLTLFTSSADGIITGNFSKVKAYVDFLNSPYIPSNRAPDVRFGDIVTLARGKLLNMENGSYFFIEDFCTENCRLQNATALWQVQKIRHRDFQKDYYYEIKFSISPLVDSKTPNHQNKYLHNSHKPNRLHSFVQKEEDYPNSFKGFSNIYNGNTVHRRIDSIRSFRPMQKHDLNALDSMVPLAQPTFLRNILLPPPPEQLNIGEYYKGVHLPTSISKTFPYSNLVYAFLGRDTNSFSNPITKSPPRPANYHHHPQHHNKFVEYQQSYEPLITKHQPPEIITHHFHHYFYMPPNALDSFTPSTTSSTSTTSTTNKPIATLNGHLESDNIADGFQHDYFDVPAANYFTATTPNYNNNYELQLPTISEYQPMYPMDQIEKGQLVRLAHIEPSKLPDNQPHQYTTSQLPLFIFPAAVEEEIDEHHPSSFKPFIQSEQLQPDSNYYSELDPLYVHANENENTHAAVNPDAINDGYNDSTTSLVIQKHEQLENAKSDNHLEHSVTTEYYLENHQSENPSEQPYNLLQPSNAPFENFSTNLYNNDNKDAATQTLTAQTSAIRYKTKPTIHGTSRISVQSHNGISNKTQSRLRNPLKEMLTNETIHSTTPRYRNTHKRFKPLPITTEKPFVKWKFRRTSSANTTDEPTNDEIYVTNRNEINPNQSLGGNQRNQVAATATNNATEKYEVLTQKSISKSVSIKVGYNGEEIPILVDDDKNSN